MTAPTATRRGWLDEDSDLWVDTGPGQLTRVLPDGTFGHTRRRSAVEAAHGPLIPVPDNTRES